MKYHIAIITALMAIGINLSSGQPKKVEANVFATPVAAPEPPEPPELPQVAEAVDVINNVFFSPGGAGTAGRTLVIPKEAGDSKEIVETEEDLNVMARILEKAASGRDDKHPHAAMGIAIQGGFFGSSGVPKNLYLEGYGALFFLNVNFPLLAPATKSSEPDDKEKTSTEWEEARRELYQKAGPGFEFNWKNTVTGGPAEEYDADKVEELKRDLTAALKNANHIRKLKSDETVTVVVSGRSTKGEPRIMKRSSSSSSGGGSGTSSNIEPRPMKKSSGGGSSSSSGSSNTRMTYAVARSGGGESHGTKLVLRASKADIESFQKDKLSLDEFRKKVTMFVY